MSNILITGITGFAGSHLTERLLASGDVAVHGLSRGTPGPLAPVAGRISWHTGDLLDAGFVRRTVAAAVPHDIVHLAGFASPSRSHRDPGAVLRANVTGTLHLLEAVRLTLPDARVLVVGSAHEYGLAREEENPLDEDTPLRPTTPYAVSKIAQDFLALKYALHDGLQVVRVRAFNHIGPRLDADLAVSAFARQIAALERTSAGPRVLRVGSLTPVRDFTDVRDMVAAYELALRHGRVGEVYNVGSGRGYAVGEVVERLVQLARVPIQVEVDPERVRALESPRLVCDPTRFRTLTGWEPRYTLDEALATVLDYWREQ